MSTIQLSLERPVVICALDASSRSEATVRYAASYCRERRAELVLVWVLDPQALRSPTSYGAGTIGTWGLTGAVGLLADLARREGITARATVRIGERARVLEEERQSLGAETVLTSADVPVDRCPACGARYDDRAPHLCPSVYVGRPERDAQADAA